jgi:hypothetical protein
MSSLLRPLLVTMILGVAVAPGYCAEPSLSVTIRLTQDTVRAGSEVRVKIVMKNVTDHQIRIPGKAEVRGDDVVPANCHATVTDAKGARAPLTNYGEKMWGRPLEEGHEGTWVFGTMEAGEERPFTSDLILSRLYDLSKPGKYTVQVRYPDGDGHGVVKSNKVTLTITQ